MTLEEFLGAFEAGFDVPDDSGLVFDYDTLPDPPETLSTGALVIRKAVHDYGNSIRVDGLWFYGAERTYRLLGLLTLATLFSTDRTSVALQLTHAETDISFLIVDAERPDKDGLEIGLNMIPHAFEYRPDSVEKHPWLFGNPPVWELPLFALTATDRALVTREDWASRDVVEGFGTAKASARLAQLLLDVGRPGCPVREIELEGELGFRGVAPGSAEIRFWLPDSDGWMPQYGLD